jgi:hypothetical protein
VRNNTASKKSPRTTISNMNSRPTSAAEMRSTRANQVNKFGTLSTDTIPNEGRESRLRIARPPPNLYSVSNRHWDQLSSGAPNTIRKVQKVSVGDFQNIHNHKISFSERSKFLYLILPYRRRPQAVTYKLQNFFISIKFGWQRADDAYNSEHIL